MGILITGQDRVGILLQVQVYDKVIAGHGQLMQDTVTDDLFRYIRHGQDSGNVACVRLIHQVYLKLHIAAVFFFRQLHKTSEYLLRIIFPEGFQGGSVQVNIQKGPSLRFICHQTRNTGKKSLPLISKGFKQM